MQIDIFQDTVCPWCRIGKKNLEVALADAGLTEEVEIRYRPFFLNPDMPAEGAEFRPYMRAKGGGRIPLEQFFTGPREAGERVGLKFDFEAIERAPNTMLSHQLVALTPAEKQEAVLEGVYEAYFEQGRDIGQVDVLTDIADAHGLDAAQMQDRLLSEEGREKIAAEVEWAQKQGISGVPFFIVNNRYAFSGAQPPQNIARFLEQVETDEVDVGQ